MISISGLSSLTIASLILAKWGQGNPMGLPLDMQEANTMICAPRSTIILALDTALFPGQPPQLTNPVISTGPVFLKANLPLEATVKSVVPGHMSSVCWQRMIPAFLMVFILNLFSLAILYQCQSVCICTKDYLFTIFFTTDLPSTLILQRYMPLGICLPLELVPSQLNWLLPACMMPAKTVLTFWPRML